MSELIRRVAVIVEPGFAPFEFGIACEAFGLDRNDDGVPNFDFRVVTPTPGLVRSNLGFSMTVERPLADAADADVVVVLPVPGDTWSAGPRDVLDVIRQANERGAWVLSVCSGVFRVAESGILAGRRATTHWRYSDALTRLHPDIDVDPDVLFVQSDRVITSAGTAAGLDACLHLLRQTIGAEHANTIARRMVISPVRDGGQAQFITRPVPTDRGQSLGPVLDWATAHLDDDLSVEVLAAQAHMSARTFARRFAADYGTTPAAWVARQRVTLAQRLLEQTDEAVDVIAQRCGFGSAAVLRQNFLRTVALTPTAYRGRFAPAG